MGDSLRHVDIMIKEIKKDLAADPPTDSVVEVLALLYAAILNPLLVSWTLVILL